MKEKVLSVFIDESGDFGQYNPASPNYYVAMVLHNQGDCAEKTKLAYTDKLTKEIAKKKL